MYIQEKIKEVAEKENLCKKAVVKQLKSGSLQTANYCILENERPLFFAKIYCSSNSIRAQAIHRLSRSCSEVIAPTIDFPIDENLRCMVLEWIQGETLVPNTENAHCVAKILQSIHAVNVYNVAEPSLMENETSVLLDIIYRNNINFPYREHIKEYLSRRNSLVRKVFAFVHMDVHRKNFIKCNNKIYIVDYENISISDPWRDLVYACYFHDPNENEFWSTVLESYFNGLVPDEFWSIMQYYCYLHLLRMIICEFRKENTDEVLRLANKICNDWPVER